MGKKKLLKPHYNFFKKVLKQQNTLKKEVLLSICHTVGSVLKKKNLLFFPACNSREQITAVVLYYFNYLL